MVTSPPATVPAFGVPIRLPAGNLDAHGWIASLWGEAKRGEHPRRRDVSTRRRLTLNHKLPSVGIGVVAAVTASFVDATRSLSSSLAAVPHPPNPNTAPASNHIPTQLPSPNLLLIMFDIEIYADARCSREPYRASVAARHVP